MVKGGRASKGQICPGKSACIMTADLLSTSFLIFSFQNQGWIQGLSSYANGKVLFLSYEMFNMLKNVEEVFLYNITIYAYFPVDSDALNSA